MAIHRRRKTNDLFQNENVHHTNEVQTRRRAGNNKQSDAWSGGPEIQPKGSNERTKVSLSKQIMAH